MRHVLFLITELQRPVGGLYRFATEYLPIWRKAINEKETDYEPLVFAPHDIALPLDDLQYEQKFEGIARKHNLKIYSAIRGLEKCYFIENQLSEKELVDFHFELWQKYRIKSEKATLDPYYNRVLCPFWEGVRKIAKSLVENLNYNIACIDAQDWLAFPAGFLAKRELNRPLICRFHSGEFGRSMAKPDLENAPVRIEACAFYEADYIIGVSVPETKFEITNLLPLADKLAEELKGQESKLRYDYWEWKKREYKRFLFFEPEKMHLIGKNSAGIPNGIVLDIWKQIQVENIANAKRVLRKMFPEKEFVILFIGRAERRKGLPPLLEAMKKIKSEVRAGLVIASAMSDEEYKRYEWELKSMGLEKDVVIDRTWLSDLDKASLLCAPDILALPSLYEPFGIVTLEGLAADYACARNGIVGPAVITGDTGGMSDVVRSGIDGFKVPVENFTINSDLLASLIVMVLEHPDLRKKTSANAAQRVQSDIFKWEQNLKHVIRTYEHAIMNHVLWKEET